MKTYVVNLGPKAEAELDAIVQRLRLKDKEEAIRRALSLLNLVAEEIDAGSKLVMENEKMHRRMEVEVGNEKTQNTRVALAH